MAAARRGAGGPAAQDPAREGRASVVRGKNLKVLTQTMSDCPPDVHLDLVGDPAADPAYEDRVRDAISRYGLTDRVVIHGPFPPERLGARSASADAFVLPSA